MKDNIKHIYDVIVIGGGPGGVTAAVYAARGGKSVKLFHTAASALCKAEHIQNYYGVQSVSGGVLYERGIAQAESVGVSVELAEVTFVSAGDDGFTVCTANGDYACKKLVVATGAARKKLGLDGEESYAGRGVGYCAVCDAFFYRKKRVAVVGAGEYALHEYSAVAPVAAEAFLLTNGEKPLSGCGIPPDNIITARIKRIVGDKRVTAVEFEDGSSLLVDGVFIAAGVMGSFELAKSVGVITDNGAIVVDESGMTNVAGLYAAGDCTAGIKQIGKAVADGVRVGYALLGK